jgi:hypothetical protein
MMPPLALDQNRPLPDDATLGAILRTHARAVPARFYRSLLVALPAAVVVAMFGWWRASAWLGVVGAFAAWADCEQRLASVEAGDRWVRTGRLIAGALAFGLGFVLLAELFLGLVGRSPIS